MSGEGIVSEDVYVLLKGIKDHGTLKAASEEAKISYRKSWGIIKEAEELLGYELTTKLRGGKDGGKSLLTEDAKKLLEAYTALQQKLDDAVEAAYEEMRKKMERP